MSDPREWSWYKQVFAVATLVTVVIAALNALALAEPYWLAHRSWVRAEINAKDNRLDRIERSLHAARLERALEVRKTIRARIGQVRGDLAKTEITPETRRIFMEQLEQLLDDQVDNERRIDELRREAAK